MQIRSKQRIGITIETLVHIQRIHMPTVSVSLRLPCAAGRDFFWPFTNCSMSVVINYLCYCGVVNKDISAHIEKRNPKRIDIERGIKLFGGIGSSNYYMLYATCYKLDGTTTMGP